MERIKELRKKTGLTQNQLAEITGLSQAYISQLEKGQKDEPSQSTLRLLADAFGVEVIEFYVQDDQDELLKLLSQLTDDERRFLINSAKAQIDAREKTEK